MNRQDPTQVLVKNIFLFLLGIFLSTALCAQVNFGPRQNNIYNLANHANKALGDIDGDGDLDLITSNTNTIDLVENIGNSSTPIFAPVQNDPWGLGPVSGGAISLIDLDGDGDLDIFKKRVYVENIGSKTNPIFSPPVLNPFGLNLSINENGQGFIDYDDDGDLDLLTLRPDFSGIYWLYDVLYYKNIGTALTPSFDVKQLFDAPIYGDRVSNLNIADLDVDGDMDIVFSSEFYDIDFNYDDYAGVSWLENLPGAGNFAPEAEVIDYLVYFDSPGNIFDQLAVGDYDGDGDPDILSYQAGDQVNHSYENLLFERSCIDNIYNSENIELGYGIWNDGGRNCLISNRTIHANSGRKSIRLVARTSSSQTTTDELDMSAYGTISVDFSYIVRSYEGNEFFVFEKSEDGGPFVVIKSFTPGVDFENDERKFVTVNIDGPFSSQTKFRIRSRANRRDYVYIDDITIHACVDLNALPRVVVNKNDKFEDKNLTNFQIYPNPNNGLFTLAYKAKESAPIYLNVFDLQGKLLFSKNQNLEKGLQKIEMDVMHLDNGFYFLQISDGEQTKIQKFYKNSRS